MHLLPLIQRSLELYAGQGIIEMPETEDEALDFAARTGNVDYHVVVGPEALFVTCAYGCTRPVRVEPEDGPQEVRALGQIMVATLGQTMRRKMEA